MLNKVMMMGRVGNVKSETLSNGTKFTKLSLAVTERWNDKQGVKQEKTTWFNVHSFQKLAEIIEKFTTVGALVYVEGKLKQDKYTDKEGVEKIITTILAAEYKILSSKDNGNTSKQDEKPVKVEEPGFHDDIPW